MIKFYDNNNMPKKYKNKKKNLQKYKKKEPATFVVGKFAGNLTAARWLQH